MGFLTSTAPKECKAKAERYGCTTREGRAQKPVASHHPPGTPIAHHRRCCDITPSECSRVVSPAGAPVSDSGERTRLPVFSPRPFLCARVRTTRDE